MARPFAEHPIGSYQRNRYGEYRPRYSKGRITEASGASYVRMDGFTYVKMVMTGKLHKPEMADSRINRIKLINSQAWNGAPLFYIKINDITVYPWSGTQAAVLGIWINLTWDWLKVRTGEELEVWVASDDATDGIINTANAAALLQGVVEPEDYTDYFV